MNNQVEQFILMSLFAALYFFLYRRGKQFRSNRIYLLSALILSVIIPMLSFEVFPYEVLVEVRTGVSSPVQQSLEATSEISQIPFLSIVYWSGVTISLGYFLFQLIQVLFRITSSDFQEEGSSKVSISSEHTSSSFFNFIFLERDSMILRKHEEAHAKLKHSLDRIFMSLFQAFYWFNPLTYLFRYWIVENHEFEADQYTIRRLDLKNSEYGQFLYDQKLASIINVGISNQFHSLIKNRIHMLSKKSQGHPLLYLFAVALVIVLGSAFSFKDYPIYVDNGTFYSQDSVPLDTTVIYNPATMSERILVTSGQMFERIDTSIIFNPETYKESMTIDRVTFHEIIDPDRSISGVDKEAFMKQMESRSTYYIETNASSPIIKVNFAKGHSGFVAEMINSESLRIIEAKIDVGVYDFDFSEMLEFEPGDYYIRRTDGGQRIDLKII